MLRVSQDYKHVPGIGSINKNGFEEAVGAKAQRSGWREGTGSKGVVCIQTTLISLEIHER